MSPLRDARGFEYMEEKEGTSKEESRLINLILSKRRAGSTSIAAASRVLEPRDGRIREIL